MKPSRLALIVSAVLIAVPSIAMWGQASPASGGDLVVAQGYEPPCLSPLVGTAQQQKNISNQIVERLVNLRADGRGYDPVLAVAWKIVDDRTIQFSLRRGVMFTNGEPFDAESAKYSIDLLIKAPGYALSVDFLAGADVVDQYTINVRTKAPTPSNLVLSALGLGGFQYPPKYTDQVGYLAGFCGHPIGTGPFELAEWAKGDHVTLRADPDYWGQPLGLRTVTFKFIVDGVARVAALDAGDITLATEVPLEAWTRVRSDPRVTGYAIHGARVFGLFYAQRFPGPMSSKLVRVALTYAIDVPSIVQHVLRGLAAPLQGQVLVPADFGFNSALKAIPFDPARAKAILAQAGYPNGFQLTFKYPDGRYPQDKEVSEALAIQLQQVGVKVQQVVLEPGEFLTQLTKRQLRDIYYGGALTPLDAHYAYVQYLCGNYYSLYCRSDFDNAVEKAAVTTDPNAELQLYYTASRILREDPVADPLFAPDDLYATAKNVSGWRPYLDQYLDFTKTSLH